MRSLEISVVLISTFMDDGVVGKITKEEVLIIALRDNDNNSNPSNTSSDNSSCVYKDATSNDNKEEGTDNDHYHSDVVKVADMKKEQRKEKAYNGKAEADDSMDDSK